MRLAAFLVSVALAGTVSQRAAPAITEPAAIACPTLLGEGIATKRSFCDIYTGTDPAAGAVIRLPARRGGATLTFDLHNRHMYSATLVESGRGYARATATIGVLTMEGELVSRAVVTSEFRKADDLFDRIAAGPGTADAKAVAPIGAEPITVEIPEKIEAVSLLGEKLDVVGTAGRETVVTPNRPIATVSNIRLAYHPARRRR
jgi:hypothetical protein